MSSSIKPYRLPAPLRVLRIPVRDAFRGIMGPNQEFISCVTRVERENGQSRRNVASMVAYADRQLPVLSGLAQRPIYADETTSSLFYFPAVTRGRCMVNVATELEEFALKGGPWHTVRALQKMAADLDQDQAVELLRLIQGLSSGLAPEVNELLCRARDRFAAEEQAGLDGAFFQMDSHQRGFFRLTETAVESLRNAENPYFQDPLRGIVKIVSGSDRGDAPWSLIGQYASFRLANPSSDGRDLSGREFCELAPFDSERQRTSLTAELVRELSSPSLFFALNERIAALAELESRGLFSVSNQVHRNTLNYLSCLLMGLKASLHYGRAVAEISPKKFGGEVSDVPLEGLGVFFDLKNGTTEFVPGLFRSVDFGLGATSEQLLWNDQAITRLVSGFEGGVNGIYLAGRSYSGFPDAASVSAYFRTLMTLKALEVPVDFVRLIAVTETGALPLSARCFEASSAVLDFAPEVFPLAGIFEGFTQSTALGRTVDDVYFDINKAAVAAETLVYKAIRDARLAKGLDIDSMHDRPFDEIELINGEHAQIEDFIRTRLPKVFAYEAKKALDGPGEAVMAEVFERLTELGSEMADRYNRERRSPARSAVAATRRMRNPESTYIYAFCCAAMQLTSEFLLRQEMSGVYLEENSILFSDTPEKGAGTGSPAPRESFAEAQARKRAQAQEKSRAAKREKQLDEASRKAIEAPFDAFAQLAAGKISTAAVLLRQELSAAAAGAEDLGKFNEVLGNWANIDMIREAAKQIEKELRGGSTSKAEKRRQLRERLIDLAVSDIVSQLEDDMSPIQEEETFYYGSAETIKGLTESRLWLGIQEKALEYMDLFPWYNPRFMLSNLEILISNGETPENIIGLIDDCIEQQKAGDASLLGYLKEGNDPLTEYVILSAESSEPGQQVSF